MFQLKAMTAGAGILALLASALSAVWISASAQPPVVIGGAGPRSRADGPDADGLGRREGYPACKGVDYANRKRCRVGAYSHFDQLFPARRVAASGSPASLKRAAAEPNLQYAFAGQTRTLDRYLDLHPVTGFLLAKGDTILVERYQYARSDTHRLTSFSMAKTIVAMLLGIAVQERSIRLIDDPAEVYVPGLKGTEFGRSPIRSLLQMSSGIAFREEYEDSTSDIDLLADLTLNQDPGGGLAAIKRFNKRVAAPGMRYNYSSADTTALGLILSHATGRTLSDFASEKLWQPLGAEADASWIVDGSGHEIPFAYFNAVLRDWARLGLMLAHDGAWQGKQVIPSAWVREATTVAPDDARLRQVETTPPYGYGYQTWIIPGARRMFALRGVSGQRIFVDPDLKLVLVQTAARSISSDAGERELRALWAAAVSQLR